MNPSRSTSTPSLRRSDDVRAGYRKYATGSHLVFYVQAGESVDIIRILHRRMDPARHL
ncbi:MAG: type II toxin-antitoxin system RelE/ParE family toxin [Gordonia sp. (in: high G+C Gram-positive bacteria)]